MVDSPSDTFIGVNVYDCDTFPDNKELTGIVVLLPASNTQSVPPVVAFPSTVTITSLCEVLFAVSMLCEISWRARFGTCVVERTHGGTV